MNSKKNHTYSSDNKSTDSFRLLSMLSLFTVLLIAGCGDQDQTAEDSNLVRGAKIVCGPNNGGISLPEGFCATLVVDSLGHHARHIAVAPNGDIYLKTRSEEGGIAALRDTTGDFRADIVKYFGDMNVTEGGILWETGMAVHNGYIWASTITAVYRWPMPKGDALVPKGEPEIVVNGFPEQRTHASKAFTFDESGHLYVIVGAPSNACQEQARTPRSPGIEPCPLLEKHGGIWRFSSTETGQTFSADARYATGLRNVVGLDWNNSIGALYVMQHGRDQLHSLWPDYYTIEESAELPAESMFKVNEGDQFSWPYGYFNHMKDTLMLSPEYGGNGETPISESEYAGQFEEPVIAFPGHWAPNDLLFYTSDQFPERYQGGAFVAFHGSWNRAPQPQQGYKVVFVPFNDGTPVGDYKTFVDGFAGVDPIPSRGAAEYRPVGLAIGPDGTLYISDSKKGRVWRVVYTGKTTSAVDTTEADTAGVSKTDTTVSPSLAGAALFQEMNCQTCHTLDPDKPASTGPSLYDLYGSEVDLQNGRTVTADKAYIRESILQARAKLVAGYMPVMPSYKGQLTKEEVDQIVSYIASL